MTGILLWDKVSLKKGCMNMNGKLDNADILLISEKGHYGYINDSGTYGIGIEVCYLAICRYSDDNALYLFLCDDKMSVE